MKNLPFKDAILERTNGLGKLAVGDFCTYSLLWTKNQIVAIEMAERLRQIEEDLNTYDSGYKVSFKG